MASRGQDFISDSQPQLKREVQATQPCSPSQQCPSAGQDQSYTAQATNFFQQTGEQMKNMAQGAAEAVKNTLGMNADNSPNPTDDLPTHTSNALTSNPSHST